MCSLYAETPTFGHQCKLRCKALNMISLFLKKGQRDQLREVSILMTCSLKGSVQMLLNPFPYTKPAESCAESKIREW